LHTLWKTLHPYSFDLASRETKEQAQAKDICAGLICPLIRLLHTILL
jgi:hypothetical protein